MLSHGYSVFTANERLTRCLEILQDAFDGQPAYLEQEGDVWTGEVLGSDPKIDPTTGKYRPALLITLVLRESDPAILVQSLRQDVPNTEQDKVITLATYDEFAAWAYGLSRIVGLQAWISPRHFAHLVTRILAPCPYNLSWPHDHYLTLADSSRLWFRWDEDDSRLVLFFSPVDGAAEKYEIQHAGDAIGRLALIKQRVQPVAPPA